jgi:hypothetical protein
MASLRDEGESRTPVAGRLGTGRRRAGLAKRSHGGDDEQGEAQEASCSPFWCRTANGGPFAICGADTLTLTDESKPHPTTSLGSVAVSSVPRECYCTLARGCRLPASARAASLAAAVGVPLSAARSLVSQAWAAVGDAFRREPVCRLPENEEPATWTGLPERD